MTLADDLDAVWAAARPVIEDAFFSDVYSIERPVRVSDGRGGETVTDQVVESGKCSLYPNRMQGREFQTGPTTVAEATYIADMPWATTVVPTDALTINSRAFRVAAVKREGDWGTSVQAELEERT